jgi:outer membrane protein OmpA-like peptidoglycan-associated protein
MSFRTWLLAGTSVTLFALAPLSLARAQDATNPDLKAAFQAFQADQSDTNKQKLTDECIAAGFQSFDDCIAALSSTAPVDQPAAAPAPSSEPAPAPAPSSEEQAAPASSAEAPPPAPEPSSSEQPAPQPPAEAAPAAVPASSEEAAPAPASSEVAAPPASSAEPAVNAGLGKLKAAVDAYNKGVAALDAGDKSGQKQVDKAKAQIEKLCTAAGFADIDSCLAQAGLTLDPLPPAAGAPASAAEPPASSTPEVTPAAPPQEATSSVPPTSELPKASEDVTPSAVEVLPPDVSAEAAPILDSAKDQQNSSSAPASAPADQSSAASSSEPPAPPAQPPAPPPKDDKAAQADIQPPPAADQSTQTEKGKPKPADFTFIQPAPPANSPDVKVIQPPKNDNGGLIFQIGINIYINNPEQERSRFYDQGRGDKIYYEDLSFGRTRETITRRDGSKIVTIYARNGDVLQRSKILPNGREIVIASGDQRDRNDDNWQDPGRDLPPLILNIPAKDYILDADEADQDQVDFFLDQPPVEQVHQIYTIDDVKRSARLRDSVRRLEVGGLTFDTGKATISRDQVGALAKVAKGMQTALNKDPGAVFLIEGHTDAVGSDVANLVLSDQRAATVARILTDFYDIPPENLVTQGYGERYLKVKTDAAEPLNRRVTIKNITTLVAYVGSNN